MMALRTPDPRDVDAEEWEPPTRDSFNKLDVQEMPNGKLKITNMNHEIHVDPAALVETENWV